MSQQIQTFSISAPGFYGLNTQDSPLDLASGFATSAMNCVIDRYGRIGARKGWEKVNADTGALAGADVKVIHELIQNDGTLTILFAGGNKLFKLNGSNAVVQLTYGGGGTAPTITADNWQCASLNGITYFFQIGHNPLIYDPAVSTTTYRRVSEKTGYVATVQNCNVCISAYGRLWTANTATNNNTIYFSDLLAGHIWSTGTAGSLNLANVWPNGPDEVVGLAAHNNYLFIFGKRQILAYSGATTPSTMTLSDTVGGVGCIARDSIQNTNTDVVFLSNSGVRSILRTIQEKSAPFRDISKNVRDDLMAYVSAEVLDNVKAIYSEKNALYLLTFPLAMVTYAFDTRGSLQDGASRVTTWDTINPQSWLSRRNGDLLLGKDGFIGKYGSYLDDTATYRLSYFTNHTDLGDQSITSLLKRIAIVVIGGSNQYITIKWAFDFSTSYVSENVKIPTQIAAEYGIAEFGDNGYPLAEYAGGIALNTLHINATGSGKIVQTGYEANINAYAISIQKIEIQAKNGKTN